NGVDDAARIQRPETQVSGQDGDLSSRRNRSLLGEQFGPAQYEMFPADDCLLCASERRLARADDRHLLIDVESGAILVGETDRGVRQRQLTRGTKKAIDILQRWTTGGENSG